GAAARNSIGLVLVAGMAIGTLFTLYFVPSLYMLFAKQREARAEEAASEEPRDADHSGLLRREGVDAAE
ncbi:MAG: hypothetical protein AAF645_05485, partial [Myxococcota bacterium]